MKNLFILAIIFLSACSDLKMKPQATTHQYFDMASFMNTKITDLEKTNSKVQKNVSANGIQENISTTTINWKQELALFAETDINKPVLRNMYLVNQSNDAVEYTAIDKKAKVQRMYVIGNMKEPNEIQVSLIDENQLYQTQKELLITFQDGKLTAYKIAGQQKILFKDLMVYEMNAKIMN